MKKEKYYTPKSAKIEDIFTPNIKVGDKVREAQEGECYKFEDIVGLNRKNPVTLESIFKKQYPRRKKSTDFWKGFTDNYNYKKAKWALGLLESDSQRLEALGEIEKEAKIYPDEWEAGSLSKKIDQLKTKYETLLEVFAENNNNRSKAVALPDKFAATDVRAALEKAVKAGYLNKQYQPIGEFIHSFGRYKGEFYKSRLAAFATAMNKKVDMSLSYPDFQRLWKIDKGQLYQNSLTTSKDYIKYQSIFESLFK